MKKSEILEFIRKNPLFALATVDENGPHVRMMLLYNAGDDGLVFVTGENKDLNKQLTKQPDAEMCFYSQKEGKQIRVTGAVEELEDIEFKKQIVKNLPFLKEWVDKEGYDVLVVYCLKHGKATLWTMDINFKPKEYTEI